jgi:hypothetical protein
VITSFGFLIKYINIVVTFSNRFKRYLKNSINDGEAFGVEKINQHVLLKQTFSEL